MPTWLLVETNIDHSVSAAPPDGGHIPVVWFASLALGANLKGLNRGRSRRINSLTQVRLTRVIKLKPNRWATPSAD